MKTIDMVGKTFGRLTVVRKSQKTTGKRKSLRWDVLCSCGKEKNVCGSELRRGRVKSCGCLAREVASKNKKHGLVGTSIYNVWKGIQARCYNPNDPAYKDYGGRGIKCEWGSVEELFNDMGHRPKGKSLDRTDNDGNYSKDNCEWRTQKDQTRNTRSNKVVCLGNDCRCVAAWAEEYKISSDVVRGRLRLGWNLIDALTTPVGSKRPD